jgi:iron complex outermembrane recepter protein
MLRRIPGITTEVQNGDSLKIHIRGVENQAFMGERPGVAVVIDGVPVFERTGRVNIDLDNIESIKVIKGGASFLFGDDALAGAVIITTKRGADNAGFKVDLEAGSFDSKKALLQAGFEKENANGHIQISRRETDGYYDDAESKADYLNGKLQYYINDSSDITLGMEISNREKGSHGTITGKTAAITDPKSEDIWSYNDYANNYEVDLEKFFATYSTDFNEKNNLMLNVYQFTDNTKYDSDPINNDPTRYSYDNDYDQVQRGIKAEFRADGNTFAWMGGLDVRDNNYKNKVIIQNDDDLKMRGYTNGDYYEDNKTDENVTAFYGELKYKATEKFVLSLNGRNDNIKLDYNDNLDSAESGGKSFNVNSYRFGGNYAFKENIDLYASISTGFRTPTAEQLFTGNNHPDRLVSANSELEPEESKNLELGFRLNTSLLGILHDIDISIFQLDRNDYIQATAGQYTRADDSDNVYGNIGDVQNRGLELSLNSEIKKMISWDFAYTYLDAKYQNYNNFNLKTAPISRACPAGSTPVYSRGRLISCLTSYNNTGNEVPRTPKHNLNAIVRIRPAQYLTVSTEMQAQSSYYADEINQEKIAGRAIFNIWANYDRRFANDDWSFFARIDNIFDRDYYNTARGYNDSNEDGIYDGEDLSMTVNPGIVFSSGLSVKF